MDEHNNEPRYARFSDAELLELAAAGKSSFREDAWNLLEHELRKRRLSLDSSSPIPATDRTPESSAVLKLAETSNPEAQAPSGIGGWLAFFVGWTALSAIALAVATVEAVRSLSWIAPLTALDALALVLGIFLVLRRDRAAPAFWKGLFLFWAAVSVFLAATDVTTWATAGIYVAWSLTWVGYWATSQRVRATFRARSPEDRAATEIDLSSVGDIDPAAE